jgi:predicted kinase
MKKPKLILLYGFASSGKTTLSKKYISEHPLALSIEGDQIISMMGQWRANENEAREIVFEHAKAITERHLMSGHDVLLPYLLTNAEHAESFREIAERVGVDIFEIYIYLEREEAINRLLNRGVWGEEGSPKLSTDDLPEIEQLYDQMEKSMSSRLNVKLLPSTLNDIDGTYAKMLRLIS